MPNKKYSIIYADPPWKYRNPANSGQRGACHKYNLMTIEQICAMNIQSIAADDCLLAMWWVPPMPTEALQVVEAWGFKHMTMFGFLWHKLTRHGKDHFGMGNMTRANAEACLFAKRGKPQRVNKGVRQLIHAPVREHSRKPDEARTRLSSLMGDNSPKIELFARQRHPGWHAIGDEIKSDILEI